MIFKHLEGCKLVYGERIPRNYPKGAENIPEPGGAGRALGARASRRVGTLQTEGLRHVSHFPSAQVMIPGRKALASSAWKGRTLTV